MIEGTEQLLQERLRGPGLLTLEKKKRRGVIMVYKIRVMYKLSVKLRFTRSCHIRIKGHSIYLTEVILCLNRRSA